MGAVAVIVVALKQLGESGQGCPCRVLTRVASTPVQRERIRRLAVASLLVCCAVFSVNSRTQKTETEQNVNRCNGNNHRLGKKSQRWRLAPDQQHLWSYL